MELVLPAVVFGVSLLLEFFTFSLLPNDVKKARYAAAFTIMLITFYASSYVILQFCLCSVLLAFIALFRVVNNGRVVADRMHPKALARRFTRSSLILSILSIAVIVFIHLEPTWNELESLLWLSLFGSALLFATTLASLNRWRRLPTTQQLEKLPTVSVCIPARNETQDLPECIESVLASTYPKLEILVLDDCSHDKTPEIIKKYAHDGVRFLSGTEPDDDWIAKNQAMNKLFDESRGDIVIFAGVDVRFSEDMVQRMVEQLELGLDMVSVLPRRSGAKESSVFIQPLRYWWELSVPRFRGGRPPVLSTCWAIRRQALKKLGEFDGVRGSTQPERHFAHKLKKSYRFILSGRRLGVTSVKGPREQFDTALRIRYPQARRRPEAVLLLLLIEAIIFSLPLVGLLASVVDADVRLFSLSLISLALLFLTNIMISALIVRRSWLVGLVSLPFLVLQDWYLLIRSMLAYEFGVVKWKERNICLPMLKVEKSLPKID